MAGQGIHRVESDVVAVGDESALPRRILDRGLSVKFLRVVVQDQKPVLASYDTYSTGSTRDASRRSGTTLELRCHLPRA